MTDQELEQLLRRGLERRASAALTPERAEELSRDWRPSRSFRKRIARLKRRARGRPPRWVSVAACAAAVLLVLVLTISAIPSARAYFQQVFRSLIGGTDMEYRFEDGTDGEDQPYTVQWAPGWLPEGYVETERYQHPTSSFVLFEKDNGDVLSMEIGTVTDGTLVQLDQLTHTVRQVQVRGQTADLYEPTGQIVGDDYMLAWIEEDDGQLIYIVLAGPVKTEELIRIAENLAPIE